MSGSHYDVSPFDDPEPEYEEVEEQRPAESIPKQDLSAKLPGGADFKLGTKHLVIGGAVLFVLIVGIWLYVKGGQSNDGSDSSTANAASS